MPYADSFRVWKKRPRIARDSRKSNVSIKSSMKEDFSWSSRNVLEMSVTKKLSFAHKFFSKTR